jgi:hypothetical protein
VPSGDRPESLKPIQMIRKISEVAIDCIPSANSATLLENNAAMTSAMPTAKIMKKAL